ncbi:MAG: hypothetical protein KKC72_17800 [Alphaproteobacteria bacterium]|nr:hypothetical protein [Alphaproteobacteria bacterium]
MSVKTIAQSPSPSKLKKITTFPQAIAAVIDGKRITKEEWDNPDNYGMLKDHRLMLHLDGKWHLWIVSDGDLTGLDWVIME